MADSNKPLIIPVFIPHLGCPHQCVFCNQKLIAQKECLLPEPSRIHRIIEDYLAFKGRRRVVELAFFGGNFLGIPKKHIIRLLDATKPYIASGKIDGIRFSTRPDTVSDKTLELIRPYRISVVEIGVQSMTDAALLESNRGHTSQDTADALKLLQDNGFTTGVQLMPGLPGETEETLIKSTRAIAKLAPDVARIYPLLVLAKSPLADMFNKGVYQPLSLQTAIRHAKQMVAILTAAGINVIRVGLQASDLMSNDKAVLAGPWHPAFGHLVFCGLVYDDLIEQVEAKLKTNRSGRMVIHYPSVMESRLRGDKNENIKRLTKTNPDIVFALKKDKNPVESRVRVENEIL